MHDHKDYVVVDKPSGVPVIPPVDNVHETVQEMVQRCLQTPVFVTTRLDLHTSGCLVLAKTKAFQAYFNGLIKQRKVQKRYRATLRSAQHSQQPPPVPGLLLTHYTDAGPKLRPPFRFVTELETQTPANQHKKWRECRLRVIAAERTPGGDMVVTLDLLTGRTHQIRGQFAAVGWPVVGDNVYTGNPADVIDTFKSSPRLQLRVISLVFAPERGREGVEHSAPDTDPDSHNVC